jgi:hypothetical protein
LTWDKQRKANLLEAARRQRERWHKAFHDFCLDSRLTSP